MDTIDIQHVFNDPNNDVLTFNANSSDDELVSVTMLQNSQLIMHEGNVGRLGRSEITITANDTHRTTATDTLLVT